MTDREQIRRDALAFKRVNPGEDSGAHDELYYVNACIALLAELEQAKRDNARDAERWGKANQELSEKLEQAELDVQAERVTVAEWAHRLEQAEREISEVERFVLQSWQATHERAEQAERARDVALRLLGGYMSAREINRALAAYEAAQ